MFLVFSQCFSFHDLKKKIIVFMWCGEDKKSLKTTLQNESHHQGSDVTLCWSGVIKFDQIFLFEGHKNQPNLFTLLPPGEDTEALSPILHFSS